MSAQLAAPIRRIALWSANMHAAPTNLAVFDFNSTLFLTPSPSPTIWHSSLIHALTTEGLWGPGWWRDIRSLELGPQAVLENSQWNGYWNEDIVAKARAAIADPKRWLLYSPEDGVDHFKS